jgi:hypothetical protein
MIYFYLRITVPSQVYGKIRDASLRIAGEVILYFLMHMDGLLYSTVRCKVLALSATLFS